MSTPLKIAIADDEPEILEDLAETLEELGHRVVIAAGDGNQLLDAFRKEVADVVITDIKMPGMDGLQAVEEIRKIRPVPIIILSAFHDDDLLSKALKEQVMAYLVKPIQVESLRTSIQLAVQRFREFQALQDQADDLKQALEDRKVIERAKGILMERAELSEPDAFRRLQLLSSQKNRKLVEVARDIVDADAAFRP
jgi:response regulator NasT